MFEFPVINAALIASGTSHKSSANIKKKLEMISKVLRYEYLNPDI